MRSTIAFLFVVCSSFCFGQTDSMFVEITDGTIRGYPIASINQISFSGGATSIHEQEIFKNVLSSFALYQNYPNPFNPSTTIQYSIPKAGYVEINIFDIQGRIIHSPLKSYQQAGMHHLTWDSRTPNGGTVSSGIYLCQVLFNGSALVKKLVLIK